jgi:Tol biopolymer transport system component
LKTQELNDVTDESNEQLRPAVLPDNKRLIYSSNQNGSYQLYSTDFVSKKSTQLTFSDSNASDPLVSPNGKNIVYLSENRYANIFAADVKTKKEERITEATKMQIFPDLSSDGTSLVYQVTDEVLTLRQSQLRIKNLQTREESVLENQIGYWSKWSPRMDEIAFLRNEGLTENLWKFRVSDGQATKLTSDGIWVQGYSYSPFSLPSSPFYWSPDGTKIAFVSNQSKIPNVCTIDNDGANLRQLTKNENNKKKYNSPMWSANGGGIAASYQVNTDLNKYEYGISLIVDNQEKEVFKSEFITRLLGWTADDKNLLVTVNDGKAVKLFEVSEQSTPKLLNIFIEADFNSLSLSPDKKTIAYSAGKTGIANIFLYSDNKKEQLTDNGDDSILFSGISWSPKGDKIFYSKQSGALQISMISDNSGSSD